MTARTSQKLADALKAAGFDALATRAEQDEFHDFLSPHAMPEMLLVQILHDQYVIAKGRGHDREAIAAMNIRQRLINGEFDASMEESDEWANSPEGQAALNELIGGDAHAKRDRG